MIRLRFVLFLSIGLAIGGCGGSPKRNYYTLEAPGFGALGPVIGPDRPAVVVGPVTVPDTVDRPQIVVRAGGNRLEISDPNRWAEPLRRQIPRILAAGLSRDLGEAQVSVSGQETATEEPDIRVAVDVLRFESVLGDAATVEAAWVVRRKEGPPARGRAVAREPVQGPGYEALVAAHAKALARVGRDIAAVIRQGERWPPGGR